MIGPAHHYGLNVSDLSRSIEFYRDTLGFTLEGRRQSGENRALLNDLPVETASAEMAYLEANGILLELVAFEHPPGEDAAERMENHDVGMAHVCFTVEDCRALYDALAGDVEFLSSPRTGIDSGATVVKCYDPDGYVIEFLEREG